jgi:hypothetical protein
MPIIPLPVEAFSVCGVASILIPRAVKVVEQRCFYSCESLREVLWNKETHLAMIEEEAFEATGITKFVLPAGLVLLGARFCPATTQLFITKGSRVALFQEWRAQYIQNRNRVFGTPPRQEAEILGTGGGGCCVVM